jgi:ABC-2 type transport system ATP-binding protein
VSYAYGTVRAVCALDLVVRRGRIVGLVGPNGSGKTTVLHLAAGLLRPLTGELTVEGLTAGRLEARARLALVPDEPTGLDELSVGEYLGLVRALWRAEPRAERRAEVLLDVFALRGRLTSRLGGLSRGWRRRAAIVAALQLAAPVTLVDEATATLDPEAVVGLRESLRTLAGRGGAVLLATQDLHFAVDVCDEIVLLVDGTVRAAGTPEDVCRSRDAQRLEDVLLREIGRGDLARRIRDGLDSL